MGERPGDDPLDDYAFDEDDEDNREAECGRWDNGRLTRSCALAGTEWCDWECPIGYRRSPPT